MQKGTPRAPWALHFPRSEAKSQPAPAVVDAVPHPDLSRDMEAIWARWFTQNGVVPHHSTSMLVHDIILSYYWLDYSCLTL